jgi:hypothetical protein
MACTWSTLSLGDEAISAGSVVPSFSDSTVADGVIRTGDEGATEAEGVTLSTDRPEFGSQPNPAINKK